MIPVFFFQVVDTFFNIAGSPEFSEKNRSKAHKLYLIKLAIISIKNRARIVWSRRDFVVKIACNLVE